MLANVCCEESFLAAFVSSHSRRASGGFKEVGGSDPVELFVKPVKFRLVASEASDRQMPTALLFLNGSGQAVEFCSNE
jgi:hypothetical protein